MNQIKSFIKSFDLYGSYFQFRINKGMKFKTEYGGVLSLFSLGVLITLIVQLGGNLFYERNPSSSYEKGIYKIKDIPVYSQDLLNSTRMKKYIFIQIPYPYASLYYFEVSNLMKKKGIYVTNIMKNEDSVALFKNQTGMTVSDMYLYYYLDLDDYNIGSEFQQYSDNYAKIAIISNSCLSKDPKNPFLLRNNTGCSKENLERMTSSPFQLTVHIPRIGYDKNDKLSPFSIKYISIFSNNKVNYQNTLSIKMISNQLISNDGWLMDNINNITEYGYYSDSNSNEKITYDANYDYWLLNIYVSLTDEYIRYERKYTKVSTWLAEIFSIIKVVFTGFDIINFYIKSYCLDIFMANNRFTYKLGNIDDIALLNIHEENENNEFKQKKVILEIKIKEASSDNMISNDIKGEFNGNY